MLQVHQDEYIVHLTDAWDKYKQSSARYYARLGRWEQALLNAGLIIDQETRERLLEEFWQWTQPSQPTSASCRAVGQPEEKHSRRFPQPDQVQYRTH